MKSMLAHLLCALLLLLVYKQQTHHSFDLIWQHGILLLCLLMVYLTLGIAFFAPKKYQKSILAARFWAGCTGFFVFSILSTYLLAYGSKTFFNVFADFQTIALFWKDVPMLVKLTRLPAFSTYLIYGTVVILPFFFIVLYQKAAFGLQQRFIQFGQKWFFKWILGISISIICFLNHSIEGGLWKYWQQNGDPLVNMFTTQSVFVPTPEVLESLQKDAIVRQNYLKNDSFERKNIVIIIIDDLRARNMGIYGYQRPTTPFLSSLEKAGQLVKVETAHSNCSFSEGGILATLSSRRFSKIGLKTFKINDLLKIQNYKVNFLLAGKHQSWFHLTNYYGNDMDAFYDTTPIDGITPYNDDYILKALDKVDNADKAGASFFYLHLMSSHPLGERKEPFNQWLPVRNRHNELRGLDSATINYYDGGVLQADDYIKQIFLKLTEKGYLQNSLVAIVADHGESLGEHGVVGHYSRLYEEQLRIPMLFYGKTIDLQRFTNLKYAFLTDVAPTMIDFLSLKLPETWEGYSLFKTNGLEERTDYLQLASVFKGWMTKKDTVYSKYIKNLQDGQEEWFDLKIDPDEKNNLIRTRN
jgi:glucan phosphoethanolaminetransferase (alkaline phosphatase superfamily)